MTKILVVDDDANIREVVCFALAKAGYATTTAADGEQALARFVAERPDLVVLDILMPELDGTEVCRRLRADPRNAGVPIIFLSSKDDEIDRILGLELGGDDYMAKPFSPRELVARVRARLRRPAADAAPALLQHGRLRLDPEQYKAWWDERELVLTLTEFGILRTLITRPGRVCTRDHLMNEAYALHRIVSDRTIDSHLRRVRAKLDEVGADPIETVHGVGYKLGPCT
ncbi:response regulator transcription factor [Sinimarinibacterium flocculans]|uniref:Two-component system OmpR family response regulator n=1 Tax=Sinimarinibacterium flocculans TaxID=985250 RepID=A0A318E5N8_9GAMM|nr:response regulator transcription factor [Sinimarinibacterium flocculans]PXV66596.1 two-component system OmpR family response regulator [Sinimarinibacterium flocculans]